MDLKRTERGNKNNYKPASMDLPKLVFGEEEVIKLISKKSDLE